LSSELVHAEKLSAVGELASGVAHEINNPLTTILGLAQLLLSRSDVTPGIRERIALMADEAARAAAIVQNLLMFSRHYPPERRPCSLADAVQRVIALKGYQLEHDKVRVTTELDHCPTVWADENQVQQVLLNLVQNAHQAMARQASERVLTAPPHHSQHGFANVPPFERPGFWTVQSFRARRLWATLAATKPIPEFPRVANDGRALRDNREASTLTWIGHATLLIQLDGVNILTDPHFSERTSPVGLAGPRRLTPPGLAFE